MIQSTDKSGSFTIWFDNSSEKWLAIKQAGKSGRPRTYSDGLFSCTCGSEQHCYALRALRGFLRHFP
ncbi:MAG: transposase [Chlamydiales bacterium]|nr:transposase [Chlamydiales bacterium]